MKKVILLLKKYPNLTMAIIFFILGIASGIVFKMMD